MAQSYDKYLYVSDRSSESYAIRLSAAVAAAQTTAAVKTSTTTPTRQGSARVGGSSKKLGIRARYFNLYRSVTAGTGATAVTRKYTTRFPVLVKADWDAAGDGTKVTIGTTEWTVSTKGGEDIR